MGPLPWCVCWCTRVFAGELWWVWGCHDAVKLVLWPKNADGAMGFGVPARTLLEVDSTVRRESPRKQRPPAGIVASKICVSDNFANTGAFASCCGSWGPWVCVHIYVRCIGWCICTVQTLYKCVVTEIRTPRPITGTP